MFVTNENLLQTPPSGYGGPGVLDELVYSGAGSGCRDDDEDACVLPDAGSGDDLITPVYVPSTRRPPSRLHKVCSLDILMFPSYARQKNQWHFCQFIGR